jgi:hypothetical protein
VIADNGRELKEINLKVFQRLIVVPRHGDGRVGQELLFREMKWLQTRAGSLDRDCHRVIRQAHRFLPGYRYLAHTGVGRPTVFQVELSVLCADF